MRDNQLFARLKTFHAYPSEDGSKLYSMTVPVGGAPPMFIEADRTQVMASAHDMVMAAYVMAKRSGTQADHLIDQAWILRPRIDCSKVRYNTTTRGVAITLCFVDRLPMPILVSVGDWISLRTRVDAICGLTAGRFP